MREKLVRVKFTHKEARAVQEALIFRRAGELGEDAYSAEFYDDALTLMTGAMFAAGVVSDEE